MCSRYVAALSFSLIVGPQAWASDGAVQHFANVRIVDDNYAIETNRIFSVRKQEKIRQWRMSHDIALKGIDLDTSSDVAGPDANHDGIRDDIETWIDQESDDELSAHAARQLAKAVQQILVVDLNDQDALKLAAREHTIVSSCSVDVYRDIRRAEQLIDRVQNYTVNTPARQQAFNQYHAALQNSHFYIPTTQDCDVRGLLGTSAVTFAIPRSVPDAVLPQ
jgi:hypothetical protein